MPMKKKITKLNRSCRVRTLHRQKGSGSTITLTEPPPHTGSTSLVDVGLCILNQLSASLQFFLWNFLIFLNRELRNDTKFCDLQQQPCFPLEALSQPGHQLLSARSHPELLLWPARTSEPLLESCLPGSKVEAGSDLRIQAHGVPAHWHPRDGCAALQALAQALAQALYRLSSFPDPKRAADAAPSVSRNSRLSAAGHSLLLHSDPTA